MYKKIQHTILEEHFEYPDSPQPVLKAGSWPVLPTKFLFTTELKNQFNNFNQDLRDAIVSTIADSPDNVYNQQKLTDTISKFNSFFDPYYGSTNTTTLTTHLSNLAANIIGVAAAKTDADITASKAMADAYLGDLVTFLNTINPQWNLSFYVPILSYLNGYIQTIYDQISNRKSSNWATDAAAAKLASNILAMGPVESSGFNGAQDFATNLANSIVQQFPNKFN
jgi:hypothetical protein